MGELDPIVRRLREQFSRGHAVLFTGAGFSVGAMDGKGRPVPQTRALRNEIWELIWPGEEIPEDATLKNTFAAALLDGRRRLANLLTERLAVDPESVDESHLLWFSMPWRRAYTLNIDDLEAAAARKYELPRRINSFSALGGRLPLGLADLVYVHLNGMLSDVPDVTFTDPQYGLRHQQTNPLYAQLSADLLAYTVVFVGTELQESLFWEYVSLRDDRGPRGVKEGRPISYLVTPDLPRDRQRLLDAYHVEWVNATHREFAETVLAEIGDAVEHGFKAIALNSATSTPGRVYLPYAAELAALPAPPVSEYLFGAHPTWDDVKTERAVVRAFEDQIDLDQLGGCLLITGTAGAGTSTTLIRVALRMVERGRDVRWLGADHAFDARALSRELRKPETPDMVVCIDDADTFGPVLMELVSDIIKYQERVLLVIGMRASRVDRVLDRWAPDEERMREVNVPLLEDSDIGALLRALEQDNKLGALKPLSELERVERIRSECKRELLVAMIEATSGEKFEVKAVEEYEELEPEQRLIYGLIAIASDLRFRLSKDEILMASNDLSNTALYALDRLTARRLLLLERGVYSLRHRRIAELVVASMRSNRQLLTPYRGLLWTLTARYHPKDRLSRETKFATALLNHARIGRAFAVDDARMLYADVEELAKDDYHYWLQRGSLEVQDGNLSLAATWLQQAKAGGAHDHRVQTEWAYYLIKSAWKFPTRSDAAEKVEEGRQILLEQIALHGSADSYPWHVLGSQMLGWLRAARLPEDQRARELETLKKQMEEAVRLHPRVRVLSDLKRDIAQEWLMTAVAPDSK